MKKVLVPTLCDFYKISHRAMYPEGTEVVYSTWTPRTSRIKGVDHVVWFGGQAFFKEYLLDVFQEHFFDRPKSEVIAEYVRLIKFTLGDQNPETKHLEELHDLGYLPLSIRALPEGTVVPTRVPVMTIQNTDPRFFWLTNFVESLASAELWQPSTSATIAYEYKKMLDQFAMETAPETAAFTIFAAASHFHFPVSVWMVGVLETLCQLSACVLLFSQPARYWFKGPPRVIRLAEDQR